MERPPSIDEDEVLAVAAALPAPDRSAYLIAVCGGDGAARLRLEKRLCETPVVVSAAAPAAETEIERLKPEQSGDRLGHYKLLEQIGEGGFGIVWIAEQDAPVKRRVALKLLKCG